MLKIKRLKPLFNQMVVTRNMYSSNVKTGVLIDASKIGTMKEYQTVIEVGPNVRDIKPGDIVYLNPTRYAKIDHRSGRKEGSIIKDDMHMTLDIPTFTVYDMPDGSSRQVLLIGDNDVFAVVEGEEFNENPDIIVEDKPHLDLN